MNGSEVATAAHMGAGVLVPACVPAPAVAIVMVVVVVVAVDAVVVVHVVVSVGVVVVRTTTACPSLPSPRRALTTNSTRICRAACLLILLLSWNHCKYPLRHHHTHNKRE